MRANELELLRASGVEPCLLMDNGGKTGRLPISEAALALRTSINLFPNWYFADPINQRGLTEYGAGYSIDRWILQSITNGKLVLRSGYLTVFAQHNDGLCFRTEESNLLLGETYTVSVLTYDNRLLTYTFILSKTGTIYNYTGTEWSLYAGFSNDVYTIYPIIAYDKPSQISIDVVAVKLEPGSISTLAHKEGDTWVLNDPQPNKALELMKCQRYQWVSDFPIAGIGIAIDSSTLHVPWFLPVTMRTNPAAIALNGVFSNFMIMDIGRITNITCAFSGSPIELIFTCETASMTHGNAYRFMGYDGNVKLLLDANL